VLGHPPHLEAQEVPELEGTDHDRDPGGEARRHRVGNVFDELPHAGRAHGEEDQARGERGQEQAPEAEARSDGGQDNHERGGGAGDLHGRAAQERGRGAGHDRGVQAVLRGDARGDGQGHGERQGHHAHHRPRHEIGAQGGRAVVLAQRSPERGRDTGQEGARRRLGHRVGILGH
jgi:hypothetical protein